MPWFITPALIIDRICLFLVHVTAQNVFYNQCGFVKRERTGCNVFLPSDKKTSNVEENQFYGTIANIIFVRDIDLDSDSNNAFSYNYI